MTTEAVTDANDPRAPAYADEATVRREMTRVFDVCSSCRRCVDRCDSFPTLFELIDRHEDRDAGRLTPSQQDRVVEQCFHCTSCVVGCPHAPGVDEHAVDVPRLMLRAQAMRVAAGHVAPRTRLRAAVLARPDRIGRLGCAVAPAANRVVAASPGSVARRVLASVAGIARTRRLPTFATQRFASWYARRPKVRSTQPQGRVVIVATCVVEHFEPAIGRDLVRVLDRNGIDCELAGTVRCCGVPLLHSGRPARFTDVAAANVASLVRQVRGGAEIVVAQPVCAHTIIAEYPRHLGSDDARLVAAHTHEASAYLMGVHLDGATRLDTQFPGHIAEHVTYHQTGHERALGNGVPGRDLVRLTGARVRVTSATSGTDGIWGMRTEHAAASAARAGELASAVRHSEASVVGSSFVANQVINELTGRTPMHPVQFLARAYGILADDVS